MNVDIFQQNVLHDKQKDFFQNFSLNFVIQSTADGFQEFKKS